MVRFRTEELSDSLTRIYGIMGEQMYLITGTEQAVLIDTGTGVGDLRACVESLTNLPITVLLSHGHLDHGKGSGQFETVYLSPADRELYRVHSAREIRAEYLAPSPALPEVAEDDWIPADEPSRFPALENGMAFHLGGLSVEVVSLPGHTPGSCMFLLREPRILIAGDACNFFTMLQGDGCLPVSVYAENLRAVLPQIRGRSDTVLFSHGAFTADENLFTEVLSVCEEVLNRRDDHLPFGFLGSSGFVAKEYDARYVRTDGKIGNLVYREDALFP